MTTDQVVFARSPRVSCPFVLFLNIESFRLTLRFQALESELAFINLNENSVNTFLVNFQFAQTTNKISRSIPEFESKTVSSGCPIKFRASSAPMMSPASIELFSPAMLAL